MTDPLYAPGRPLATRLKSIRDQLALIFDAHGVKSEGELETLDEAIHESVAVDEALQLMKQRKADRAE